MNHTTPGLPVHHPLLEFTQTHVHRVGDAIQPFHSLGEVAQSCLTHSDPMDWSLPGSSVHGISQARVLEWVAIAFSKKFLSERQ